MPEQQPDALNHAGVETLTARLRELGASGQVRVLSEAARTAQQAADGLGCEVGAIASSLIFDADGSPVLILTSGAHRVDTQLVRRALAGYPVVWAAAGHAHAVFDTTYVELKTITAATEIDVV